MLQKAPPNAFFLVKQLCGLPGLVVPCCSLLLEAGGSGHVKHLRGLVTSWTWYRRMMRGEDRQEEVGVNVLTRASRLWTHEQGFSPRLC